MVRCIVAGGMGAVYEAVHKGSGKRAALKVMRPELLNSKELRERFRQETMVTASIESDHIVSVFDGGTDEQTESPFLVMELLRGEDLHTLLARRGTLDPDEVVSFLRQAALGLTKAHDAGIIHRDLKPDNLFIARRDDGSPFLKILDFGIAKVMAESMSAAKTTRAIGTPFYMAPEQIRGDAHIGTSADLYALAHVAYHLLTGGAYWAQEHSELKSVYTLLVRIVGGMKEAPTARAARAGVVLPAGFDTWFLKATALDPLERHDSVLDLVEDFAALFTDFISPSGTYASGSEPNEAPQTVRDDAIETVRGQVAKGSL